MATDNPYGINIALEKAADHLTGIPSFKAHVGGNVSYYAINSEVIEGQPPTTRPYLGPAAWATAAADGDITAMAQQLLYGSRDAVPDLGTEAVEDDTFEAVINAEYEGEVPSTRAPRRGYDRPAPNKGDMPRLKGGKGTVNGRNVPLAVDPRGKLDIILGAGSFIEAMPSAPRSASLAIHNDAIGAMVGNAFPYRDIEPPLMVSTLDDFVATCTCEEDNFSPCPFCRRAMARTQEEYEAEGYRYTDGVWRRQL